MNSKITILSIAIVAVIVSTSVGMAYSEITENTGLIVTAQASSPQDVKIPTPIEALANRVTNNESRLNAMFQTVTGTMTLGVNETGKLEVLCPKDTTYISTSKKMISFTPQIPQSSNLDMRIGNIQTQTILGNLHVEYPNGLYVDVREHKDYDQPITATASIVCLSP